MLEIILLAPCRLPSKRPRALSKAKEINGPWSHPAVVIFVAIAILTFIMVTIVPKFKKIFDEFGMTLLYLTCRRSSASPTG